MADDAFAGAVRTDASLIHLEKRAQNPLVIQRLAVKKSLAAALILLALASSVQAQPIQRIVPAGRTSVVFTYTPIRPGTCEGATGVVKLVDKPRHGRTAHHLKSAYLPTVSRFTHRPTGCPPLPTTGFAITYTPDPGFHGEDSFTLDADFTDAGRHEIDVFTIFVE